MKTVLHSKPWITAQDLKALEATLKSAMIGQGDKVADFEAQIAEWIGADYPGVAVGTGTAAVLLALKVLGCGIGTEVVLPSYNCHTVLEAVINSGAKPVLCDVSPNWVVEPDSVAPCITAKTKAIIIPHIYGIFADVKSFRYFEVPIIEDCAQAIDAKKQRETIGDVAVFSFHATKCLTTGEGGMAVSSEGMITHSMRVMRDGDDRCGERHVFSPMSDIGGCLGLSQLSRYGEMLARRRDIAARYIEALYPILPQTIENIKNLETMFFRFPLRVNGGIDRYQKAFEDRGVHIRRGVDNLLHRLLDIPDTMFPNTVRLFNTTILLPIYPALEEEDQALCIETAKEVILRELDINKGLSQV